jgi:acyl transferase domain-containing protein
VESNIENSVAIISASVKLPGANDIGQFWEMLCEQKIGIRDLEDSELKDAGVSEQESKHQDYVKRAGVIDDVYKFDHTLFGFSKAEAKVLDVQQRLILEQTWTLFEAANINPTTVPDRCSAFIGSAMSSYLFNVLQHKELVSSLGEITIRHGNDKDYVPNRVSYKYNLTGPSVAVQTTCASSLTAVHLAVCSLLSGESNLAVAGGVSIRVPQEVGYLPQVGGVLSVDGFCRPFEAGSTGTIFTNGSGLVLLKRYEDALEDGDNILALIKGSACANDGSAKVGFTAPSVQGQVEALADAVALAGIDPSEIAYIEAHGTGTQMGDPIEIEALKAAYGTEGSDCLIGAVKANVGHLGPASGVIGLIKTALMLNNRLIVANPPIADINPSLDLNGTRFKIAKNNQPIGLDESQVYAGVSSFGMGGANCHVILEGAEPSQGDANASDSFDVYFYAHADKTMKPKVETALFDHIAKSDDSFTGLCAASQKITAALTYRGYLVAQSKQDALQQLGLRKGDEFESISELQEIIFAFPGQGSQKTGMYLELYSKWPEFKHYFDIVRDCFSKKFGYDLIELIGKDQSALKQTEITQPTILACQWAFAESLIRIGYRPEALIGHSLGEITAATIAGVFSIDQALEFVAFRARVMEKHCAGSMVAAICSKEDLVDFISDDCCFSAFNSSGQVVISSTRYSAVELKAKLREIGVASITVNDNYSFHHPAHTAARDEVREFLDTLQLGVNRNEYKIIPTSSLTLEDQAQFSDSAYWANQIVAPVNMLNAINNQESLGEFLYLDIGPTPIVANMIKSTLHVQSNSKTLGFNATNKAWSGLGKVLGELWKLTGVLPTNKGRSNRYAKIPGYLFNGEEHVVSSLSVNSINELSGRKEVLDESLEPDNSSSMSDSDISDFILSKVKKLLSDDTITLDSNFQESGGNSILVLSLYNEITDLLGKDIPLEIFGSVETIRDIVEAVSVLSDVDSKAQNTNLETDQFIVDFVKKLLQTDDVSINSNFYDSGGNSILALSLINGLSDHYDIDLPIEDFMDSQNLSGISGIVQRILGQKEHE